MANKAITIAVVAVLLIIGLGYLTYSHVGEMPTQTSTKTSTTTTTTTTTIPPQVLQQELQQDAEDVIEGNNLTLKLYHYDYSYPEDATPLNYPPVNMSAFWDNLTLINASNPKISKYIQWLQTAVTLPSSGNIPPFNLTIGYLNYAVWNLYQPKPGYAPSSNSLVRFGIINLPFGGQIVVVAYSYNDSIIISLDGRIANETAWLNALARVAVDIQEPSLDFMESPVIDGGEFSVYEYLHHAYHYAEPLNTIYVLWRIGLDDFGYLQTVPPDYAYVIYNGHKLPLYVYVFLEEPIYLAPNVSVNNITTGNYWAAADLLFWDVVGAPTLALGVNLQFAGEPMPEVLYNVVPSILWETIHMSYPSQEIAQYTYTPFIADYIGLGICSDQSYATASFMADALGAMSAYVVSVKYNHAVSVLIIPPGFQADTEVVNLSKYNLTGIIIDNTASNITVPMINAHITWNDSQIGGMFGGVWVTQVFYPFAYSVVPISENPVPVTAQGVNAFLYTGIPETLYNLPPLLQFPWTKYYVEELNITAIGEQYEEELPKIINQSNSWGGLIGPSNWTVNDYYQYAETVIYREMELGNGVVPSPTLAYLP